MLENTIHTPGPWKAYYIESVGWSVKMANPREGYDRPDPICSMAWWQFDKPGIINNDISGANARLIAAAPELLSELKKAVEMLENTIDSDQPACQWWIDEVARLRIFVDSVI